ncbi:MAG: ergothioneine biosynthesis protein EgtB [Rubrivivax sp.]|nr:ergothioneine biosynthesis protein EgtB [Rubrivivax sp.]
MADPVDLARRLAAVRARSVALAAPLSAEDCQAQSMPEASPIKWHLAHTTWFFETLVLERFEPGFRAFDPSFRVLFNSYYNGVGAKHPRSQRGLLTRPALAEVLRWREQVQSRLVALLRSPVSGEALALIELGLQHEQQHQELMLTDLLHLLSCHPGGPVYDAAAPLPESGGASTRWIEHAGGTVEIGHDGSGFAFDNETPRHATLLPPHAMADRPVTQGQWAEFVADGGYRDPRWWLAAGWDWVAAQGIEAPLHWRRDGAGWSRFSLHGLQALRSDAPVAHLSLYEADAYAHWRAATDATCRGARLPTEAEWEHAAPQLAGCGQVWEWTSSGYASYPGYRPWAGAVGEYNGKFMVNQYVLRGGSIATPPGHARPSYRNFFPADARWQFSGLRLARDLR